MQTVLGRMPEAARDVAARLRMAAAAAGDAEELLLPGSGPSSGRWQGEAAEAHYAIRQGLRRRATSVREATAGAGAVLAVYAARMEELAARERAVLRERDLAQQELDALRTTGGEVATAWERGLAAQARLDEVLLEANAVANVAAAGLSRIREGIPDRPLSLQDHAGAGVERFLRDGVVVPVRDAWAVTGDVLVDRGRWWESVSALPGGMWEQVRHPLDTGKAMLGWEEWSAGRVGAGIGALGALLVPVKLLGKLLPGDTGPSRFPNNIADPNAPRPVLQTLDELFEGVNLKQHEHFHLGHALRRHVDVDDDYLHDRLDHGTLEDDATRGHIPSAASSWTDLDTANRTITDIVQANEAAIRAFAAGSVGNKLTYRVQTGQNLGRVLHPGGGNRFLTAGSTAIVTLKRDGRGGVYVHTAYVE